MKDIIALAENDAHIIPLTYLGRKSLGTRPTRIIANESAEVFNIDYSKISQKISSTVTVGTLVARVLWLAVYHVDGRKRQTFLKWIPYTMLKLHFQYEQFLKKLEERNLLRRVDFDDQDIQDIYDTVWCVVDEYNGEIEYFEVEKIVSERSDLFSKMF
jgi:hypothetical protein